MDKNKNKDLEEFKAVFHMFSALPNEKETNLAIALNHAEKVVKSGKKVKIVSKWKSEEEKSVCEEFVPIKSSRGMKRCGKPLTHEVSWEIDRFYGKKHAVEAFCEKHALAFVKRLKKPEKNSDGTTSNYEPIEIKRL